MTPRVFGLAALLVSVLVSQDSQAQEILFTNNAVYLDTTTTPQTARVTLNGYMDSVFSNGSTYSHVGVVLSNSYSTYNDIYNPAANSPGTTFGYAANLPFGTLPTSFSWHADIALPVQTISTDPSHPTYITASFYLVNKNGQPYNNSVFSTYCFMTYLSGGKIITSPAGGPYIMVEPPGAVGMDSKRAKDAQASSKEKKDLSFPNPSSRDANLNGFWEIRPSSFCQTV
jgi:hypothetical protein